MLGYISAANVKAFQKRFEEINFLIGDFKIEVYSYNDTQGWFYNGTGKATTSLEGNVIFENLQLTKENVLLKVQNTIVIDQANESYKLMSLDVEEGNMTIYGGILKNGTLTFYNQERVANTTNDDSIFKLIYKEISIHSRSLIIGCSKDQGKTWLPFVKNIYHRVV